MLSDVSPTRARKSTTWRGGTPRRSLAVRLVHPHFVHRRRAAAARVEQRDARPDELVEVLVARDDDRLQAAGGPGSGKGPDDVVSLVATHGDERDPEGLEHRTDPLHCPVEVGLKRVVQLLTGGLVVRVALLAKRGPGIVDPGDVVGPVLLAQAQQEVHHPPRGGRVFSFGGPERPCDHREEGAIDQGVAVDQEELGRGVVGHRGEDKAIGRSGGGVPARGGLPRPAVGIGGIGRASAITRRSRWPHGPA